MILNNMSYPHLKDSDKAIRWREIKGMVLITTHPTKKALIIDEGSLKNLLKLKVVRRNKLFCNTKLILVSI